ncbi:Ig-like domain-containing protein [Candidatus Saccharibacteria bacterium]|nr:Ig-like domain-containing protein [Candidatus Saccharibacteria bacterium]
MDSKMGEPIPEKLEPEKTTTSEPTEDEIVDAFKDETPTKEEITAAFAEPSGENYDEAAAKKQNRRDVIFSAVTAFLITVIGGAFFSLLTYGNFEGITAMLSGDDSAKILSVTPTKTENGVLANDSHFIVKTVNGSVEKLGKSIYLDPAIDYRIVERIPGAEYEIVPASALSDNTVFNVDSIKNGVAAYKWAFQTKKALSVSKIYPANGASYVSEDSVIEVNFSYPDVENVEDHFKTFPHIDGSFEKTNRGWRFSPSSSLDADTTYEITITSGLTYGEEIMSEDFHSTFSTFARTVTSQDTRDSYITIDKISTFTESEAPVIVTNNNNIFDEASYFDVERISNSDDYIRYLKGESVTGESIGHKSFQKVSTDTYGEKHLILDDTLSSGYYIFRLKSEDDANLLTANVQVNNLRAYAFEAERDLVFWVAENDELKQGAKINFKGNDYYTDENGLLKLDNFSDYSDKLDYAKIGDDNPLIIGIDNFKNDLYPSGFIYTDRPLYKPTDTIKIWGYVPLKFFADAPDLKKFNLSMATWQNSENVTLFKKSIIVNPDGTFSAELALDNFKDVPYGYLNLVYNDANLATKTIAIEDYTLENYTYEIIMPRNYVLSGEDMNFKIKVSHVTGFPAANKDLVITYNKQDYYTSTNAYGEASVSLPTNRTYSTEDSPYITEHNSFEVKSAGAEYNKYSTWGTFYAYKSNLELNAKNDEATHTISITANNLDLTREADCSWSCGEALISSSYSGPATLTVYEHKTTQYQVGTRYDQYTKKNVPDYRIRTSKEIISTEDINIRNGKYEYGYSTDYKPSTEDTYYSYSVQISATDSINRPSNSYNTYYHYGNFLGSSGYDRNGAAVIENYGLSGAHLSSFSLGYTYSYYRFGFRNVNGSTRYNLGDKLSLGLYDASGDSVENTGKVLAIGYKERIVSATVSSDDTFDYDFDYSLYPGARFVGAYFKDGRFYRVASSYYDYDDDNAKITVSIETDKASYEPGDHVKAKVILTYPDGSRVNSGKVNLSVVNDAVFNAASDNSNILGNIYANKNYKAYSMSTSRDYDLTSGGGLGGGGAGVRSNFGDTIFFGEKSFSGGEVEFEFDLNDVITSFRLTAIAVSSNDVVSAGSNYKKISSFLPLSISTVMPKKVKNTDDLVLNATAPVAGSDTIHYTFEIKDTDKRTEVSGVTGENVYANLGKLELGSYTVKISGRDDAGNEDAMEFPVEIIETAQEVAVKQTVDLSENKTITPTKNPIIVEIYNKEAKNYLDYLTRLETNLTERLDTQIAYYKAQDLHNKLYKEEGSVKAPDFSAYLTESGSLKPLINAEGDYILTALANFYAKDYFELKPTSFSVEVNDDTSKAIEKLLVLASFKEPVLLDLDAISKAGLSKQDHVVLGLAYAFIGDYDAAKEHYNEAEFSEDYSDLYAILSTMINKGDAIRDIERATITDAASDYLNFAIVSFFDNNEAEIGKKETVTVVRPEATEKIEFTGLTIEKRLYSSAELSTIEFRPSSNDFYASYYYQGRISDVAEFSSDIFASFEGESLLGRTVDLVLDISELSREERNGELNIALPTGLKFSATFTGADGLYLSRNNNEYVKLSLNERYTPDEIRIPLYIASPGNYEVETVIFIHDGAYHLSNSVDVNLNK